MVKTAWIVCQMTGKKAHTTGDFIWFSYIRLRIYNNHFKKISLKSDCVCVAYFIWRGNNLFGIMLKINGFSKGFFFMTQIMRNTVAFLHVRLNSPLTIQTIIQLKRRWLTRVFPYFTDTKVYYILFRNQCP